MKALFIILCILASTIISYSQQNPTSNYPDYEEYLRKSKAQKKTGVAMVIGGLTVYGLGRLGASLNWDGDQKSTASTVVGLGIVASSIPFFIISGANKRKAASISLGSQQLFLPQNNTSMLNAQKAFTLTLKVGL
jgi:hypothetical protein